MVAANKLKLCVVLALAGVVLYFVAMSMTVTGGGGGSEPDNSRRVEAFPGSTGLRSGEVDTEVVLQGREVDRVSSNLKIAVRGPSVSSIEVAVYEWSPNGSLDPASWLGIGQLLLKHVVSMGGGDGAATFLVPEERLVVAVIQSIAPNPGVEPIVFPIRSRAFALSPDDIELVTFDLTTAPQIKVSLGSTLPQFEELEVALSSIMPPGLSSRYSVSSRPTLQLLGSTGEEVVFVAKGGSFVVPMQLRGADRHIKFASGHEVHLQLPKPYGRLKVYSDSGGSRVMEMHAEVGANRAELRSVNMGDSVLSLQAAVSAGVAQIFVRVPGGCNEKVRLSSLAHDVDGSVEISVGDCRPASITVQQATRSESPKSWSIEARPRFDGGSAARVAFRSGQWTLGPLKPGVWDLFWVYKKDSLFGSYPALEQVALARSEKLAIELAVPDVFDVGVRLENWSEVPPEMRPSTVKIGGRPCRPHQSVAGRFSGEITRYETLGSVELELLASGFGSVMQVMASWRDGELFAQIPTEELARVSVRGASGEESSLGVYQKFERAPVPFGVFRGVEPWPDGYFRFEKGDVAICEAFRPNDSSTYVGREFWGFVLVNPEDGLNISLSGRWIDVVAESAGIAYARANLNGVEVSTYMASVEPGLGRLWLPSSVQWIDFDGPNGRSEVYAAQVGRLLRL